ncbi:MAG: hypothetical protein K2Q25_09840 [Mycobacteriaceae bacterium]|nr:hypothetical protein [Mycobacteriaceae bacterium]
MIEITLHAAAFGEKPGAWPLPGANTPRQFWLRAVAAGGQGRYASAYNDLAALRRSAPTGRLASLGLSAYGSFLRQLGWHALARGWDGRALAVADTDPEACSDALIGLAADALGMGRFAAAATLLTRVDLLIGPVSATVVPRVAVRRQWVGAELAMAVGEGAVAVRCAEQAVELARATLPGSARHLVKSDVVLAAALCSAGAVERARAVGEAAFCATDRLGLTPLRWALACLLSDLGSVQHTTAELRDLREVCAERVRHAGGRWHHG